MGTDNGQSTIVDLSAAEWLGEIKKLTDKFQMPGVDIQAIVDWQRKDIEASRHSGYRRLATQGHRGLGRGEPAGL